jgi:hypothetical protein
MGFGATFRRGAREQAQAPWLSAAAPRRSIGESRT